MRLHRAFYRIFAQNTINSSMHENEYKLVESYDDIIIFYNEKLKLALGASMIKPYAVRQANLLNRIIELIN